MSQIDQRLAEIEERAKLAEEQRDALAAALKSYRAQVYSGAASNEAQMRKGAAWALREILENEAGGPHLIYRDSTRGLLAAIERGEVEVGKMVYYWPKYSPAGIWYNFLRPWLRRLMEVSNAD